MDRSCSIPAECRRSSSTRSTPTRRRCSRTTAGGSCRPRRSAAAGRSTPIRGAAKRRAHRRASTWRRWKVWVRRRWCRTRRGAGRSWKSTASSCGTIPLGPKRAVTHSGPAVDVTETRIQGRDLQGSRIVNFG